MKKQSIAIIGLGLIGGSIAKALTVQKCGYRILACDHKEKTLQRAQAAGWVDSWSVDPKEVAKEADIVVLCVPVCSMFDLTQEIAPVMPQGSVLTDVGSVKGILEKELQNLLPIGIDYVGGHPMAGSEKSGLDASDAGLFVGRPFVIIPAGNAKAESVDKVKTLAKDLRAVPVVMNSTEHDLATAMVSHMPHLLSAALMLTAVGDEAASNSKYLAAGCFRDMTRVSGADPRMWTDICLTNKEAILTQLAKVQSLLSYVGEQVAEGDEEWLMDFFTKARVGREQFGMSLIDGKGE